MSYHRGVVYAVAVYTGELNEASKLIVENGFMQWGGITRPFDYGDMPTASLTGDPQLLLPAAMSVYAGVPLVAANATSAVAVFPGYLGGAAGFRGEIRAFDRSRLVKATAATALGGLIGSLLLLVSSNEAFAAVVPFLLALATLVWPAEQDAAARQATESFPAQGAARRANGLLIDKRDLLDVCAALGAAKVEPVTVARPDYVFEADSAAIDDLAARLSLKTDAIV